MDTLTLFEIAAVVSPIASMVFAYLAFRRGHRADEAEHAKERGVVLTEIGYMKAQVDGINHALERKDERYAALFAALTERVAVTEQSAKSAHRRMDEHLKEGHHDTN